MGGGHTPLAPPKQEWILVRCWGSASTDPCSPMLRGIHDARGDIPGSVWETGNPLSTRFEATSSAMIVAQLFG
jgi:hypothetical protein